MADTEKKIGCYICSGCGIGEAVDVDELVSLAEGDCDAAIAKSHPFLCSEEGLDLIRKDIADEGVNTVVLAACSPRAKKKEFVFPEAAVQRESLREFVAWICEPGEEDTQMLAADYVRMGCARAKHIEVPDPYLEGEFNKAILVVGGGVAGMSAALAAAKAGYETTLVEKAAELGGFTAKLHKSVPTKPPYRDLEDTGVGALIDEVKSSSKIKVLTDAAIQKIDGGPCKFEVAIKSGDMDVQLKAGGIVLATGFDPYDASKLGHLGYGKFEDVVTNVQFEEMTKAGKLVRPSDGAPVKNVLFIQCAGSRDDDHLRYCSSACCNTTLKQATYLKQNDADSQAYVLYKDMRTPGQMEEFYRQVQRDGAVFIRGELKELAKPNGKITAIADDVLLGEAVDIEDLDLVVLATGMVSSNRMEGETVEPLTGDDLKHGKHLNLGYRQGPELPNLKYGYPDSHYICFPYESRRTGIYPAGTVRRAMDSTAARRDGVGAALKAIQAVEMISRGEAVHPRAGDKTWPDFFLQRCTQCKRCTEECPFGAINEDAKGQPQPNRTRCRRCGVCMGACPERIISFANYSVGGIGDMIKAFEVPDEFEEKPRVVAFVCENDAYPLLDQLAREHKKISPFIRFIPLRCLGGTNIVWVADALSRGVDGLMFLGCKHGDDYQCHFIKGSEIAGVRLTNVQDTLERLVLEKERICIEQVEINDADKLLGIIENFMETLDGFEPNPYKGF